jgi:lysophospholipase L1-like esterase
MSAKLVTLGDSLTHGFQHGAIRRTHWSFPGMIARALGIGANDFRQSDFDGGADQVGGPLLDLEELMRRLTKACGPRLGLLQLPRAGLATYRFMSLLEDYWERGAGTQPSNTGPLHHNLGVWGFDVLDALTLNENICRKNTPPATDNLIDQIPEFGMYRSARRALNPSFAQEFEGLTAFAAAQEVARREGGIENLLITLGANNVLGCCVRLNFAWSQDSDLKKLAHERTCTIWQPAHFETLYKRLIAQAREIGADRVFVATVPHVTVPPVTRGVTPAWESRGVPERVGNYYEYYTRFWTWDDDFDARKDPHFTREQAMLIDRVIDDYNDTIERLALENGFHVVKLHEVLDRLAYRRNDGQPRYDFPAGLVQALAANPKTSHRVRPDGTLLLDTRFFQIPEHRPAANAPSDVWLAQYQGGLFGLDGVHPTTTGYGLIAHEVLKVMQSVGVGGADPNKLDWVNIVQNDTLLTDPPGILSSLERALDMVFSKLHLEHLIDKVAGLGSEAL